MSPKPSKRSDELKLLKSHSAERFEETPKVKEKSPKRNEEKFTKLEEGGKNENVKLKNEKVATLRRSEKTRTPVRRSLSNPVDNRKVEKGILIVQNQSLKSLKLCKSLVYRRILKFQIQKL